MGKEAEAVEYQQAQGVAAGHYIEIVYRIPLDLVWRLVIAVPSVFASPLLVTDPSVVSQTTAGPYYVASEQYGWDVVAAENLMPI